VYYTSSVEPFVLWFCVSLDVIKYSLNFPYLSPVILRKELEILMEQHGEDSLDSSKLVDSHAVIFWNLVSLTALSFAHMILLLVLLLFF